MRVWAPHPRRVDVVLDKGRRELTPGQDGWFEGPDLEPGTDYSFSLDGGPPRPDPRSSWQPEGIDGPSRTVDHADFEWTDHAWSGFPLPAARLYELHVGTFTPQGTFDAAIGRLDHLTDLGVNAIELMPLAEFSGDRGWGYDGVDLYAPHHGYGGPDGLKRLVDAAHTCGLAVVVDVVYNHLGPAGNYLNEFGPYFTDRYGTPWGAAVNLDGAGSDEVRAFFIDNALMWLRDYHLDGLRIDAIHAIVDTSAVHLLEELADSVQTLEAQLGRDLWVIAESDLNDPKVVWSKDRGGYGVDAQWSDDFHHSLHALLTGETTGYYADFGSLDDVAKSLRHAYVYDGQHSSFRGRRHGRPIAEAEGYRFLGYLQNHDQIGNRARGERSSALMSPELVKVAAALVLTSPFVPMLFMGEEWGATTPFLYFTDHRDEELGRAVSKGRKAEFAAFGWDPDAVPDPQSEETFLTSKIRWDELDDPRHADLLEWHRELIRLRRALPALSDGRLDVADVQHSEAPAWLVLRRGTLGEHVWVACNFSGAEAEVPVPAHSTLQLSSGKDPLPDGTTVRLPTESVAIYAE
ncbi:MAG: malto-oligosyltrehalose trehalohydrolase [Actinomycetota bacterium]|nr:malto-oligosyltrehalose trehalohydrolase [Actinomycetota bacterium]